MEAGDVMGSISSMFSKARDKIEEMVWGAPRVRLLVVDCPDPVDPNREPGFMCRAGEDVVCDGPDQHVIATAVEDIKLGDDSDKVNEQFYWFQAPPQVGEQLMKIECTQCKGRWVSSGMHLHFKGGWR